jgi:predicted naringenin-chalcone synthase
LSVISSIGVAVPSNSYLQAEIGSYMAKACNLSSEEQRKLKVLYAKSGIEKRYSVLSDFSKKNALPALFHEDKTCWIEQRMSLYMQAASKLAKEAVEDCIKNIDTKNAISHLITISCTGMSAPGIDLELIESLKLSPYIKRSSINFMGCYAAVHGLKQANDIVLADPSAKVLVVSVELCTIHFQNTSDHETLLANSLFADGAAAILVSNNPLNQNLPYFSIKDFYSLIIPSGKNDMAWSISSKGFLMTLSSYIPSLINEHLKDFVKSSLSKILQNKSVKYWAVHPGGKKILEATAEALNIDSNQLQSSYSVLKNYGNMSSPSILFVLHHMLETNKADGNKSGDVFGIAFGPGLVMESCLLHYAAS